MFGSFCDASGRRSWRRTCISPYRRRLSQRGPRPSTLVESSGELQNRPRSVRQFSVPPTRRGGWGAVPCPPPWVGMQADRSQTWPSMKRKLSSPLVQGNGQPQWLHLPVALGVGRSAPFPPPPAGRAVPAAVAPLSPRPREIRDLPGPPGSYERGPTGRGRSTIYPGSPASGRRHENVCDGRRHSRKRRSPMGVPSGHVAGSSDESPRPPRGLDNRSPGRPTAPAGTPGRCATRPP
jgi:hypothetical protein